MSYKTEISVDMLAFLGRFREWLNARPSEKTEYGEFHVMSVELGFDGEPQGSFILLDSMWTYVEAGDE